jgi:hypothetical protein
MNSSPQLLRSCSIQQGVIQVDGRDVFTGPADSFAAFATAAFRALAIEYPKFHKMDNLAKLGFLAAEHLLAGQPPRVPGGADRTGVVLATAAGSLDTDLRYEAQRRQGLASPALFVYTLPNIVVGEICIRHGIKGENLLLVAERYDPVAQVAYVTNLFAQQRLDRCLGGWIDLLGQNYRAFFYLAGPGPVPAGLAYTAAGVATLFLN